MSSFMRSGLFVWRACFLMIALATAAPARAVTRTYVGPVGGNNWNFAPNWSPFGVPQFLDDVSLIPSDSASRTCFFDINQPGGFLVRHGTVVIAPTGSGSISLTNDVGNILFNALSIGIRGDYTQASGGVGEVVATTLNGGTIDISNGTFVSDSSFTMISGTLNIGFPGAGNVVNNGTFNFAGGATLGTATFTNNGTLVLNSSGSFNFSVDNHGTIVFNNNGTFFQLANFVSVTLPANRTLATTPAASISERAGTFTQFGNVNSSVLIFGGTWDQ